MLPTLVAFQHGRLAILAQDDEHARMDGERRFLRLRARCTISMGRCKYLTVGDRDESAVVEKPRIQGGDKLMPYSADLPRNFSA